MDCISEIIEFSSIIEKIFHKEPSILQSILQHVPETENL